MDERVGRTIEYPAKHSQSRPLHLIAIPLMLILILTHQPQPQHNNDPCPAEPKPHSPLRKQSIANRVRNPSLQGQMTASFSTIHEANPLRCPLHPQVDPHPEGFVSVRANLREPRSSVRSVNTVSGYAILPYSACLMRCLASQPRYHSALVETRRREDDTLDGLMEDN
jgi:hypothetical protein